MLPEREDIEPPVQSGYRIRVGMLEIRRPNRWDRRLVDYQLIDIEPVGPIPPPELTPIIANYEEAIKLGHSLLRLLRPYCRISKPESGICILYFNQLSLWHLCITVCAALCAFEGTLPQWQIDRLSENSSWTCHFLVKDAVEKTQRLRLPDRSGAASKARKPTVAETEVADKIAGDFNTKYGVSINREIQCLTAFQIGFQMKSFEE